MARSEETDSKDFGADGIDIQTAMLRHVVAHPDHSTRPKHILWNGEAVWTSFEVAVPEEGRIRLEFLSGPREPPQGVDVKVERGSVALLGGERVQTLRTWHDPRYEERVEYPYKSEARILRVWNTYYRSWPDGRVSQEKWTGNAGFKVQEEAKGRWLFRCSHGLSTVPDFSQLVFRLSILDI